MKRSLPLCVALGLLAAGCATDETTLVPTRVARGVELSNREPGACCRPVESVEVRSGPGDAPTSEALGQYALARGANYVVYDTFTVLEAPAELVLTRARLFSCPAPALPAAD